MMGLTYQVNPKAAVCILRVRQNPRMVKLTLYYLTYLAQKKLLRTAKTMRLIFVSLHKARNPAGLCKVAATTGHAHVAEKCAPNMSMVASLKAHVGW